MRALRIAAALLALPGIGARAAADVPPMVEARVGPYRIAVDRISVGENFTLTYRRAGGAGGRERPLDVRRTAQLQIVVRDTSPARGGGLAQFQIFSVGAAVGGRPLDLAFHGGSLESVEADGMRAYLFIPEVPPGIRELRAIDGQIVHYERAAPVEIELPLPEGAPGPVVRKEGVEVAMQEVDVGPDGLRVTFRLEAGPDAALVPQTEDGSCGVTAVTGADRPVPANGGGATQTAANRVEYRLVFPDLREPPKRLRIRVLLRSGPRRTYPFRLERVPLPRWQPVASPPR